MAKRLAFMTYGRLVETFGHPDVQGFWDRVPHVFGAADNSPGFLCRADRERGTQNSSWGEVVTPKCWGGENTPTTVATLSVWEDIESVAAFAYHGHHGEAMTKRKEWFVHEGLPEHVAWWTDADTVRWSEAADRMDQLFEQGSSAQAFSIRDPFDEHGCPYKLDATAVRVKAGQQRGMGG